MFHRAILASAILLLLVLPSQARQTKLVFTGKCLCSCLTAGETTVDVVYANQISCVPLENKTCNVEVNGLIRSGTVAYCEKVMREVNVRGLTPGSPAVSSSKSRSHRTHVEPNR
jgi:hypothetical protein